MRKVTFLRTLDESFEWDIQIWKSWQLQGLHNTWAVARQDPFHKDQEAAYYLALCNG